MTRKCLQSLLFLLGLNFGLTGLVAVPAFAEAQGNGTTALVASILPIDCSNATVSQSAVCQGQTTTNPIAGPNGTLRTVANIIAGVGGLIAIITIIIAGLR